MKQLPIDSGMYHSVSREVYDGLPYVNASLLKQMVRSSKTAAYAMKRQPPDSPALRFGSAFHTAILEPHLLPLEVAVAPKIDRRTKEGKQLAAQFEEENKGKTILSHDDMLSIERMQEAISIHKIANDWLAKGDPEVTCVVNPIHGDEPYTLADVTARKERNDTPPVLRRSGKCRIDWVRDDALIDVKTCQDASPEAALRSSVHFGYHLQAAWYRELHRRSVGLDSPLPFIFIFVEKTPPHGVLVCELDKMLLEIGWTVASEALQSVHDWEVWGAEDYAGGKQVTLECPSWLANKYKGMTEAEHVSS